jgi:class 3 adenylate cyclase
MPTCDHDLSVDDLRALVESGNELAAAVDLDKLLENILRRAGELTQSKDGCVLLAKTGGQQLYFAAATGEHAETLLRTRGEFSEESVPVAGSKAGAVFQSGQAQDFSDVQYDPGHYKGVDRQTGSKTESMVCAPLTAVGERLGVMQVLNKRSGAYTPHDLRLLQQFATQAAIAIRNARLIQSLLAHMGLYASPKLRQGVVDLTQQLRAPMRTELLTVLFADMRGFTQFCQRINSPNEIQRHLDEFLSMLAKEVLDEGGFVNKFLGDGVLAIFREKDHPIRAVRSAFAMLAAFQPLRVRWDETIAAELDFLDIGIGIVTDTVMIGTIGSHRVRDFTAIGTPVILAAAFEKQARGGKHILVDQRTYSAVKDLVDAENLPSYKLRKGDQETGVPFKQYHLMRLRPEFWTKVFISHNSSDRGFVKEGLIDALRYHGIDTWSSGDDIRGGEAWVQSIHDGLKECEWVVVVVSQNSAGAPWVHEEINIAAADPRRHGKIFSIRLDDTPLEKVHPHLSHLQALDARVSPPIAEQLRDLIGGKRKST